MRKTTIGLSLLGFVAVWLLSILALPFIATHVLGVEICPDSISVPQDIDDAKGVASAKEAAVPPKCVDNRQAVAVYGQVGDMFGAVNALFSGLALLAVAITLYIQGESRRRENKPFVVPDMSRIKDRGFAKLMAPTHRHGNVVLPLQISVTLENCSNEIALRVAVSATVSNVSVTGAPGLPLPGRGESPCKLTLEVESANAKQFADDLCAKGAKLSFSIDYESVEGVAWSTKVDYMLTARSDDHVLVQGAVTKADAEPTWTAETTAALDAQPVISSWKYGEGGKKNRSV